MTRRTKHWTGTRADLEEFTKAMVVVEQHRGQTWNDGGHWETWIYKDGDTFWKVARPTDYHEQYYADRVRPKPKITIEWMPI